MVWLGLISYPLYLWHWPLLSFTRIVNDGAALAPTTAAAVVVGSIALATITYLWIEKPVRFGNPSSATVIYLTALMCVIGCAGYTTTNEGGFAFRQQKTQALLDAANDHPFPAYNGRYEGMPGWIIGHAGSDEVVLVGDSTLQQYYPRIAELSKTSLDMSQQRIVMLGQPACLPIPEISSVRKQWNDVTEHDCSSFMQAVEPLLFRSQVKKVVFAAFWSFHFNLADFYLTEDGPDEILGKFPGAREHAFHKFGDLVSRLAAAGKTVFVILETPTGAVFDPMKMLPVGLGSPIPKSECPAKSLSASDRADQRWYRSSAKGYRIEVRCNGDKPDGFLMYRRCLSRTGQGWSAKSF